MGKKKKKDARKLSKQHRPEIVSSLIRRKSTSNWQLILDEVRYYFDFINFKIENNSTSVGPWMLRNACFKTSKDQKNANSNMTSKITFSKKLGCCTVDRAIDSETNGYQSNCPIDQWILGNKEFEAGIDYTIYICFLIWSTVYVCLLYTSPSPRDGATSRMPSSA